MSNFPENQDLNNTQAENNLPEDELSTIFSNPVEHNNSSDGKKKKKRLLTVIASLLVVVILVGSAVAVVKLVPEKEDNTSSQELISTIKLIEKTSDDLKTITVSKADGNYEFFSETVTEKTESESEDKETVYWYLKGYNKELLNTSSISSIATAAANVTAFREITEMSLEDCGLASPEITVKVVTKEDEEYSILIGKDSFDNSGCYIKLSDNEKIYICNTGIKDTFTFEPLDFAATEAIPAFPIENIDDDYISEEGNLESFDKIVVKGKNITDKVVIEPNKDELLASYMSYMVTYPSKRIAENVDPIYAVFTNGLNVSGAYSFDVSAASLKAVGLDNPDIEMTMYIGKQSFTYKFALQEDGSYAVICSDSKLISKVEASNVTFGSYKTTSFYSSWICLISIDTISSFVLEAGDETFNCTVDKIDDEESEESYNVTINGKKVKAESFQSFYHELVALACTEFTIDDVSTKPDYRFTFTFNDENGGGKTVTEFYKVSETRYQYVTDGVNLGKVNSSALKKLASLLEKVE